MSVLPNSPADDIASILSHYDVGDIGQDIVIGPVRLTSSNPPPPHTNPSDAKPVVVGLRDVPTDVQPNPAYARDEPSVQFLVHSADRTKRYECWQKAEEVKNTLLGIDPVGIAYEVDSGTGRQVGFVAESDSPDVIYAGFIMEDNITSVVDDEEYMLLDFNFRLIREYNIGSRKSL